jgi:AcrR family transcriptional regulator
MKAVVDKSHSKETRWKRRPDERPVEIADAAMRVFAEKGFDLATLDEVAEKAGVSKGTIYLYYKNKEDLLVESVGKAIEANQSRVIPLFLAAVAQTESEVTRDSIRQVLEKAIGTFFELVTSEKNRVLIQVVMAERQRSPGLRELQMMLARRGYDVITKFLRFANKNGVIDCPRPEITAQMLLGTIMSYPIMNEILRKPAGDIKSKIIRDEIMDFILRGLGLDDGGERSK